MNITVANKAKVVNNTKFRWYDKMINPYVGCTHGCAYCYVRFLVLDKNYSWGDFVRYREHIKERLPKEIKAKVLNGQRVCLGTATDPYQPLETTHRLTRFVLEQLATSGAIKVGVYTKSDLVLEDLDLFKKITNSILHMTITPLPEEIRSKIERAASNEARFAVVRKFREAGIRVQLNVAPMLPTFTESLVPGLIKSIKESDVEQFFADPMQPYKQSMDAMEKIGLPGWGIISQVMKDKTSYSAWKALLRSAWMNEWKNNGNLKCVAIWSDHENKVSEDMSTGLPVDPKKELK